MKKFKIQWADDRADEVIDEARIQRSYVISDVDKVLIGEMKVQGRMQPSSRHIKKVTRIE